MTPVDSIPADVGIPLSVALFLVWWEFDRLIAAARRIQTRKKDRS